MPEIVTEPPVTFVPKIRTPDGSLQPMDEPYAGWQHAMHQRMLDNRAALLAHLQHDESGLDVAGVAQHLSGMGMNLNPYCVVTNSGDREARKALAKHDAVLGVSQIGPTPSYIAAYFLGNLGLSLIDRPPGRSTSEMGQSFVHEGAHANGITEVTVELTDSGAVVGEHLSKRGFKVHDGSGQWQGQLGEEAFAILAEGGYNQAVRTREGRPFAAKPHRVLGAGYIHPKYIHEGGMQHHFVLGAMALEVLGAYDPELAPALIEARKSQEGIDAMVTRLDAISAGLGRRLLHSRSVGWGRIIPDDGVFFLRHALKATGTATGEVLNICEDGPMSQYFSRAGDEPQGAQSVAGAAPERERIEVQDTLGDDAVTRILREVADTMRDDGNMS